MGLGDFFKKVAPMVIGGIAAGPLLGGLGGVFGGAAGGGIGGLIGAFQSSGFGQALGLGIKGYSLLSSFRDDQFRVEQARLSNAIQSANTLETIKLFDLKEEAFDKEEQSIKSASQLQSEQLSESRDRISRSLGFELGTVGRRALELEEKFRELTVQEQKILGSAAASAASRGVRVSSAQVTLQQEEIKSEVEFARDQLQLARDQLSQNALEIQQQATDAIFDADMQARLNLRNKQIQEDRLHFEREANKIKEKTARHLAALQGITIPDDTNDPNVKTPEQEQELQKQREAAERIRAEIDPTVQPSLKGRDLKPGDPLYGPISQFSQAVAKGVTKAGRFGAINQGYYDEPDPLGYDDPGPEYDDFNPEFQ